jgi:hypothetical protein
MAKALLNSVFGGFSGKSGNLVFRQLRGQTIIAQPPDVTTRKPSPAQMARQGRFAEANAYAKRVLADPLQRRSYAALAEERNRKVDTMVIGDFLTPPVVEEIETSGYQRKPDGLIRVLAIDDVEVVSVEVSIKTADGVAIESGPAEKFHGVWQYAATAAVPNGTALTITATAKDRPGHDGSRTIVYL